MIELIAVKNFDVFSDSYIQVLFPTVNRGKISLGTIFLWNEMPADAEYPAHYIKIQEKKNWQRISLFKTA